MRKVGLLTSLAHEDKKKLDIGEASDRRPDSPPPHRNQFLRYLRLKLDAFRSEISGPLAEESSQGGSTVDLGTGGNSPASLRSSTPELAWLFSQTPPPSPPPPARASPVHEPGLLARAEEAEEEERPEPPPPPPRRRQPRAEADIPSSSSQPPPQIDLKEELKALLEQIIDSHPEALDAIESVRQSRLGRLADPLFVRSPVPVSFRGQ